MNTPKQTLREAALALYKAPFTFLHGYIRDAGHNTVADQGGFDGQMEAAIIARVRGWGRIGYMPDAEALQDEAGALMAEALTTFWGSDELSRLRASNAALVEALKELVACHASGGFVQPDSDVLDAARAAVASAEMTK